MLLVKYNISYNNIVMLGIFFYMVLLEYCLLLLKIWKEKYFYLKELLIVIKCLCIYCDDFKIC